MQEELLARFALFSAELHAFYGSFAKALHLQQTPPKALAA